MNIKLYEIIETVDGKINNNCENICIKKVSTDTRQITENSLFIPIKGERFDGHDFVNDAFNNGAVASFSMDEEIWRKSKASVILVKDTKIALGKLAGWYRNRFDIKVIGITGSVGKTSTKEMVSAVLSSKYKVHKNKGNFNNDIGLPLTLLELDETHEVLVVEMGMSGLGEISYLSKIARPDVSVITNIKISHIEKLGSRQNILKAKMEIIDGMSVEGTLILNGEDSMLKGTKSLLPINTVFYGMDTDMEYYIYDIETKGRNGSRFKLEHKGQEVEFSIPLPGKHNIFNSLAAIVTGNVLDVPMTESSENLQKLETPKMRLEFSEVNGITIINDSYNASPDSVNSALNVLADIDNSNVKIAVLGDMLELGDWSIESHKKIGKNVVENKIDYLITVGEYSSVVKESAIQHGMAVENTFSYDDIEDASEKLKEILNINDVVLIKGSRGMKMEKIIQKLNTYYGG